jgi:serine-type D-Ala-D-Ala carboxypeptidase/endopeptidase
VIATVVAAAVSLQSALDRRVAGAPGTGIVVGFIDHGRRQIFAAGSAGNGSPADERTLFEIGSVTKTFTATTLATMVLAGRVHLNDPIAKYLPAGVRAPSKDGAPVTLLDLAEQRSGLPRLPTNMQDVSSDDPYASYTSADMYSFLNGYALTRDPGAAYEYSNYGVGLLGQLLAARAGTTYAQLVRRSVLDPLGMSDTTFAAAGSPDPAALAVGHDLAGRALPAWHFQAIMPAGGMLSSVDDMLRYLRCNMGKGPLAQACLFAQRPRAAGAPNHAIGLIWNVNSATGIVSHDGDTSGFHAVVAISRDRQSGVVALSNGPVVADIGAHAIDPSYPIGSCPASVPASKTDPESYAGIYCNASGGLTFSVYAVPGSNELSIDLSPQPAVRCRQTDPDTCVAPAVGATLKFVRADGKIVGLWLIQGGRTLPAVRLDAGGRPAVTVLASPFPAQVALDPPALRQYVGTYICDAGTFTVTLTGAVLYVRLTGQPAIPVYASAKDRFFYKVVDAQIRFDRDSSGMVDSLTLHQDGRDIQAQRTRP